MELTVRQLLINDIFNNNVVCISDNIQVQQTKRSNDANGHQ